MAAPLKFLNLTSNAISSIATAALPSMYTRIINFIK
jgi:hypothetical protein